VLPPLFIIGCARSVPSILGEFFETNSESHYFFEDDIWSTVYHNKIKLWVILAGIKLFHLK